MTIAILNNVRAIPMYAKVPHSESSIFIVVLASTSFALYSNRLATIALMCLCLQNRYITSVIVIIEITEDVNVNIFMILLRKKFLLGGNVYLVFLLGGNVYLVCLFCKSKISLSFPLHM